MHGFGFGSGRRRRSAAAISAQVAPGYLNTAAAAPYTAWGVQRLVAAYAGPLLRIRRSDAAVLDVSAQIGGDYPDYAAITAWAAGSALTVETIYDQTGNGRHLVQPAAASQPLFDLNWRLGGAAPVFFSSGKTMTAGGLTLDRIAHSYFLAAQHRATFARGILRFRNVASSLNIEDFYFEKSGIQVIASYGGSAAYAGGTPAQLGGPMGTRPAVMGWRNGAASGTTYSNATSFASSHPSGSFSVSANMPDFILGTSAPSGTPSFALVSLPIYDSDVGSTNAAAIIASLNTAHAFDTAYDGSYNVSFDGDSITEGAGATGMNNMVNQLTALLTKKPRIVNNGVSGTFLATLYSDRTYKWSQGQFTAGRPNVVFIQAGTNDLQVTLNNGTAMYTGSLTPLVSYLKGLGYLVVVCTLLPRGFAASDGREINRLQYNAAVVGNAAAANLVLDLASHPVMGPTTASANTALYGDGLHPTDLGYRYLAGAPSGTFADSHTYYDALQTILRSTALGSSYVP